MVAKTIGVATAGFALAANAFMIPSTMALSKDQAGKVERIDFVRTVNPAAWSRVVKLDCPQCTFAGGPDLNNDVEDVALILDFSTSEDAQMLSLNGRPFFPHTSDLIAHEVPASIPHGFPRDSLHAIASPARRLFYASRVSSIPAADGSDAELIDMDFNIHGIDETDVTVDGLSIRLLKDEQGRISIADIIIVPVSGRPAHAEEDEDEEEKEFSILPIDPVSPIPNRPSEMGKDMPLSHSTPEADCRAPAFICRLKAQLEPKIDAMRNSISSHQPHNLFPPARMPCPGRLSHPKTLPNGVRIHGGPDKFWALTHGQRPPHMMDRPGRHHPHRGHRGGRHGPHGDRHRGPLHTLMRVAHRAFWGFVLPVLIGVAAGMAASLTGMLVGTLLAFLWIKFVRGGRRASPALSASRAEEGQPSEKAALMKAADDDAEREAEEPLPVYVEKEEQQERQKQ